METNVPANRTNRKYLNNRIMDQSQVYIEKYGPHPMETINHLLLSEDVNALFTFLIYTVQRLDSVLSKHPEKQKELEMIYKQLFSV